MNLPLLVNDTVGPSVPMNYRSNGKIAKANVCIPRWWRWRRGEKDEGGVALGLKLGLWVNLRQNGGLFCKVIRGHLATREAPSAVV